MPYHRNCPGMRSCVTFHIRLNCLQQGVVRPTTKYASSNDCDCSQHIQLFFISGCYILPSQQPKSIPCYRKVALLKRCEKMFKTDQKYVYFSSAKKSGNYVKPLCEQLSSMCPVALYPYRMSLTPNWLAFISVLWKQVTLTNIDSQ